MVAILKVVGSCRVVSCYALVCRLSRRLQIQRATRNPVRPSEGNCFASKVRIMFVQEQGGRANSALNVDNTTIKNAVGFKDADNIDSSTEMTDQV